MRLGNIYQKISPMSYQEGTESEKEQKSTIFFHLPTPQVRMPRRSDSVSLALQKRLCTDRRVAWTSSEGRTVSVWGLINIPGGKTLFRPAGTAAGSLEGAWMNSIGAFLYQTLACTRNFNHVEIEFKLTAVAGIAGGGLDGPARDASRTGRGGASAGTCLEPPS
jgi:hypothetical protein